MLQKICITGSNGKTTTTLLTYHILKNAGFNVGLGGNVGQSFAHQVAENNFDYYVLEVSSFQLDRMYDFKAEIAILTNITPDHLDRYNYINLKITFVQNSELYKTKLLKMLLFFCADDGETIKHIYNYQIAAKKYSISLLKTISDNGAYLENNNIILTKNTKKNNHGIRNIGITRTS